METVTITKRELNGKLTFNKRFDDYEKGFYGKRISREEYLESCKIMLERHPDTWKAIWISDTLDSLGIKERFCYEN